MRVILASKSPRRKEILEALGFSFEIITTGTDESCDEKNPERLVEILSERKGQEVYKMLKNDDVLVISSDTVVTIDGKILGKPKSKQDAFNMLKMLSGKKHTVTSGLSINYNGRVLTGHANTNVYFASLSDEVINSYIETNDIMDKAGAYAVQGMASMWIDKIDGCYFNVVGLPVRLLNKLINELGLNVYDIIKG